MKSSNIQHNWDRTAEQLPHIFSVDLLTCRICTKTRNVREELKQRMKGVASSVTTLNGQHWFSFCVWSTVGALMLHFSVYLCCSIHYFKRSTFFPLIFIASSLSTKNISSIDWGRRGANSLRKMKVRKYKALPKMGLKYHWVWWNIFSGWTESLSFLRLRTKQRNISKEENFSLGQVKI